MKIVKVFKKKLHDDIFLLSLCVKFLISVIAMFAVARGYTFITQDEQVYNSAPIYRTVAKFMSIEQIGICFLLGGLTVLIGAITFGKWSHLLLVAGGVISTLFYFVMFYASVISGLNDYSPQSLFILLAGNVIISIFGGLFAWTKRKKTNM